MLNPGQSPNNQKEENMARKSFLALLFCLLSFSLVLGFGTIQATAETIELTFAHPYSPMHPQHKNIFIPWAEKINKETNGQVTIKFIPGGALGKPGQAYSVVEKGIADITFDLQDYNPGRFPLTSVFELPFMIKDAETASKAMWKTYEAIPAFQKEYENVKLLWLNVHAPGGFCTVKTPVRTLKDLQGLKMRTASAFVTDALKLFGSVPVTMPVTEVYTSLERGVVDGTVLVYDGIVTFKLDDLLKYVTVADFYTMTFYVLMNKAKYESLPDDVKKVIDDNSGEMMSALSGRQNQQENKIARQKCLDKGIEEIVFSSTEQEKLVDLTMPLRNKWVKDMEAKGLPGEAVLETAVKYINEFSR
jgi:TRAP-type transport system periplasmic protein